MINYLFDVDGTLTPSRGAIDSDFQELFIRFFSRQSKAGNKVFFVTGSDKDKTIEQVGRRLWLSVDGCFQNSGNQLYKNGHLIQENIWHPPLGLIIRLKEILNKSLWHGTATNNIEKRIGVINFSTIGRSCTQEQREEYEAWDLINKERTSIQKSLQEEFPELDIAIGGQISMDIYPRGKDKAQVLGQIHGRTVFFGDNCLEGGNDYTISQKCDEYYNVKNWKETRKIIGNLWK